jgi:cyanophycinase
MNITKNKKMKKTTYKKINDFVASRVTPRSIPGSVLVVAFAAVLGIAFALAIPSLAQSSRDGGLKSYSKPAKSPEPARPPTFGAVLLGGHGMVDEATRFFCEHSGGGEIVVLAASGKREYTDLFHHDCPANSVTTFVITSYDAGRKPEVAENLRRAHAIFFAGGDQSNYLKYWSGTSVQDEINNAIARGVPEGGISAGLAIQGEFVFAAFVDTVTSPEALANPYNPRVTLEREFLKIPPLKGVITDSHFSQRERMGRSIVFLARLVEDGWTGVAHGIGIDETTAVLADADGKSTVVGKNSAYFMSLDHRPERCLPGEPLTVRGVEVYKLPAKPGSRFDLKSWTGEGGETFTIDVIDGKITRSGG